MLATSASTAVQNATSESTTVHQNTEHKRKRSHQLTLPETAGTFCKPLQVYELGQTIYQYFSALRSSLDASSFKRVEKCDLIDNGLYLHKRVIRGMDQTNKGTVTHHVVVYLKEGSKLHSLDFGPDNGSDVTSNIFMEHPSRKVLKRDVQIPPEDTLPLMFVGLPDLPLEYGLVSKAVEFAESKMYHAMKNNCIHFADFIVRVLSRGKIRGAPMIYDVVCGDIPLQDPPESLMLAMFGMSWFTLCDGSPMTARFMASIDLPTTTLQHSVSLSDIPSKKPEVPAPVLAPSAPLSSPPAAEEDQKFTVAIFKTEEATASSLVQATSGQATSTSRPAVVKAPELPEVVYKPAIVKASELLDVSIVKASAVVEVSNTPAVIKAPQALESTSEGSAVAAATTAMAEAPKMAKAAAVSQNSQNPASEQAVKADAMAAFAAIASTFARALEQQVKQGQGSVAGKLLAQGNGAEGMASSASTDSLASADTAQLCVNGV